MASVLKTAERGGRCLKNAQMREGESKVDVYKRHRFCLVMENALSHDYVSEKLWDAFAGGCVPVYYVCPNPEFSPSNCKTHHFLVAVWLHLWLAFSLAPDAPRYWRIIYCPALGVGCDAKQPQRLTL